MEERAHTSASKRPQGNACAASVQGFDVVCRDVYIFISDAVLSKETDTPNYVLSTVHAWRDLLISRYERVASSDCSDDACGPRRWKGPNTPARAPRRLNHATGATCGFWPRRAPRDCRSTV